MLGQQEVPPVGQPLRFLEREAEIATFRSLLSAARAGAGRLVVVEGGAGIGKTRLLAAARELAALDGFVVLSARAGELESGFAFGLVRQLFDAPLAALPADERALVLSGAAALAAPLFAAPLPVGAEDGSDSSFAVLYGLYWLVVNLAARSPIVLVVDDLHVFERGPRSVGGDLIDLALARRILTDAGGEMAPRQGAFSIRVPIAE